MKPANRTSCEPDQHKHEDGETSQKQWPPQAIGTSHHEDEAIDSEVHGHDHAEIIYFTAGTSTFKLKKQAACTV